jgi:hypothetical protein
VSHCQILCIVIFYCKTCKTKESMMRQFNNRFVYLQNSGKVAKYGIGKRSVGIIFGIKIEDFVNRPTE